MHRSDWKLMKMYDYDFSFRLFKRVGGGPVETEAQFANFLYKVFGPGIYSIVAWQKGHKGMWGFYYVELKDGGFRRVKKTKKGVDKDIQDFKLDLRKKKRQLKDAKSEDEKKEIEEEINEMKEDSDFMDDLAEPAKRKGFGQYLKASTPVYASHSYEALGNNAGEEAKEVSSSWF